MSRQGSETCYDGWFGGGGNDKKHHCTKICYTRTFIPSFCTHLHYIYIYFLQVNVMALSICTREVYQSMKERNVDDGHIININRYAFILLKAKNDSLCTFYGKFK